MEHIRHTYLEYMRRIYKLIFGFHMESDHYLMCRAVQLITCDCHSHLVTKAGSVIMNSILHSLSVIYSSVY